MNKKEKAYQAITSSKLLPLFYHDDAIISFEILQALYHGGVRTIEYTNRGANALTNFKYLKENIVTKFPDMLLGIGTIKNNLQAFDFISAGADFIVSPTIDPEVGLAANEAGLLWIPGCMTATEIDLAERSSASLVKIFPGNILGPGFIAAIKELFPNLKFMPTGGVEPEINNLKEWFNSGVVAVGMGSKLISKTMIENQNFSKISEEVGKAIKLIKVASSKN